jgi:ribosomal protein S18 acetylase RimI-like enzyme
MEVAQNCEGPLLFIVDIFPAGISDLGSLRHMERVCFLRDAWPLLDLIAVLTWPDVVRLKAVIEGRMVGFIASDPRPSQGLAWIATLAVLPSHRNQGIARKLIEECEKRISMPVIRLCVRRENVAAIKLYESSGFRYCDIWTKYYSNGGDALVMEKKR